MTDSAPHETDELWPFTVLADGQPTVVGVETCLTALGARPTSWTDAVVRDGKTLLRIADLTRGTYGAWARVTRGDEHAVIFLGSISMS